MRVRQAGQAAHPILAAPVPATGPARRRRLVPALLALLALFVLLLLVVATQRWWLGPLLSRQLSAASGRAVHIGSMDVGLTAALEPVVHLRDVDIENAPWADSRRPFAKVQEAIALVSWRSLGERRPVIALLTLRDGEVDLERLADGLRNWRLRDPDNRGPGLYKILALQAERATVRFRHTGLALDFVATATANTTAGEAASAAEALPTHLAFTGRWRELPFRASVATGPALTLFETGITFPLRGELEAGGARLVAEGRAGDVFRAPVFDARVQVSGDSLAPFHAFAGPRHDGQQGKPFSARGRLEANEKGWSFSAASGRVGATDLAGDVGFAPGQPRGRLRVKLRSESADAADLRWLMGNEPPAAVIAHARASVQGSPPAVDAPPLPGHRFARDNDAELALEARRLRAAELPWLRSLSLDAVLADGRLAVSKLDAGVAAGGRASGRLDLDLRSTPMTAEGVMTLRGLRLENLLPAQADKKRLTGQLQAEARLRASGDSAESLRASATGSLRATLTGGSISSLLDAEIGLQGGRIVRSMIGGAEAMPIRCAVAVVDLRQGAGRVRSLVFDTERTRTTGTGSVDFAGRSFDIVLTPEAKQGGLFVLDRSIRLHGPWATPARELVARAAAPAGTRTGCPAGAG